MHVENFKIFCDLVETESFSRAAKRNGITQSAVSQQLRAMERHFDVLIVDRSHKQFRLTPEGKRIHASAQEILNRYDTLRSDVDEMRKIVSGVIHISTVYSIGLHELPPYIKKFLQDFPAVNVRLEYRRSNLVYEDVLGNSVDLGLVAYPLKNRQTGVVNFLQDKLVVAVSPQHPLAKKSEVDVKELAQHKVIAFDQDIPTRKAVDQMFKDFKLQVSPVMEFDNIETVKRAVEINAGVALLPSATLQAEIKAGTIKEVKLKGIELIRPLGIIYRKGRVLTPAIRAFITSLTGKPFREKSGAVQPGDED